MAPRRRFFEAGLCLIWNSLLNLENLNLRVGVEEINPSGCRPLEGASSWVSMEKVLRILFILERDRQVG